MSVEVEWIKSAISLSLERGKEKEEQKTEGFLKLEKEYLAFDQSRRDAIRTILYTQFEAHDIIYVLSNFVQYMNIYEFKEDIFEKIMDSDIDCYQKSMLELQLRVVVKGFYEKRRRFHDKNVEDFGCELTFASKHSYCPVEKRNRKRIVIVTSQILDDNHSPTQVVLHTTYVLQQCLGYEVLLFVCPPDAGIKPELWYYPVHMRSQELFRNFSMRVEFRDTFFDGYQINMQKGCQKEYDMMLEIIHAWNPWFVLDMGSCNPVIDLTNHFTTLVSMGMSIECPVTEADILLRFEKLSESVEMEYQKVFEKTGQKQIFLEGTMPILMGETDEKCDRKELNLPEDDFLIVIVGNRLDEEISDEFVQILRAIVENEENVSFVFIGRGEKFLNRLSDDVFKNRIFFLGYCNKLMATYAPLNLYLNPKRMGGGYSAAYALAAGLPVVTLPECDVENMVGEHFVVQNYDEMIETVRKYLHDENFYKIQKKYAEEKASCNSVEKLTEYVSEMLQKIADVMEEKEE